MLQQDVAVQVGVTPAYISKLEKGINPPSDELCIKLAGVLHLDADDLRRRAFAERQGMDLEAIVSSVKKDPLAGLNPQEQKLVREWRKLDPKWQQKVLEVVVKAQEVFEVLEVADTRRKARSA